MTEPNKIREVQDPWDVVICGGGLAGLLLARQLHRELPGLSITVLERTARPLPDACHKVGESSVELASQYLESLGLESYLLDRHLIKLGLRFFPGGGELPLAERTEIGPCAEPIVRSYQLDRGRLESDLRDMLEADGHTLIEAARVRAIDLGHGGDAHRIEYELDGEPRQLRAHWVVDATGRTALLRRKLKLTRGSRHAASAGWYRVKGRVDLNDMVPASATTWHQRPCAEERWRSTNHFMGPGYWAWLIPLSTGYTSVGLVIHDEVHDKRCIAGVERMQEFFAHHEPHLARLLEQHAAADFLCLHNYSHNVARGWSAERWAVVGEAGAFVDPLYSPGSDFIALANCFTVEMIRQERQGGDLESKANQLNSLYRALVSGAIDLFRSAAPVYGHPSAMGTKVYWDNFSYWSLTCHHYKQHLYRLTPEQYEPFSQIGRRFVALGANMQQLLREWATVAPEQQKPIFIGAPQFPSVLIDAHVKVAEEMTTEETLSYMRERLAQAEEIAVEIVLRVVQQLGPEQARGLLDKIQFSGWDLPIPPERLDIEALVGRARRARLSPIARDVEHTLGRINRHEHADQSRDLLAQGAAS